MSTSQKTKTLYLIRHLKANFSFEGSKDFERELNPQGVNDSLLVAKKQQDEKVVWDLIIYSHAFRSINTAQ